MAKVKSGLDQHNNCRDTLKNYNDTIGGVIKVAMSMVDALIADWKRRKASLRCQEVADGLGSLGFVVKEGKAPGHKTFSHPDLADFHGGSWNCGHGKNPEILRAYIVNIIRILEQYRDELA
jgi:hypothetical protein